MMNFANAKTMIANARRVLITTHVRPDPDALGSTIALKGLISSACPDSTVDVLLLSEPGDHYMFLLDSPVWLLGRDITAEEISTGRLDEFDLVIVVDTCAVRQLPGVGEYLQTRSGNVLIIDHHLAADDLGSCRLTDTNACAAGEIVLRLAQHAHWQLSETIAQALFVAIAADTGWFRFENASADCYRLTADLVAAGAKPNYLYHALFQNFPPARIQLIGRVIQTMQLICENRLAVMQITRAMLQETGALRSHIENIVNECQQIGSVELALLMVEQDDGTTRCSLRSRADIDVNAIAQRFGGGGHARASGLSLEEPLPQASEKLIPALKAALSE